MRWWASALVVITACGVDTRCPDTPLTYDTFGEPFLISWCRGCHSRGVSGDLRQRAPDDINFDTVSDARRHATRIGVRAGPGGTMPPAGGPSAMERALLADWIGCAAP